MIREEFTLVGPDGVVRPLVLTHPESHWPVGAGSPMAAIRGHLFNAMAGGGTVTVHQDGRPFADQRVLAYKLDDARIQRSAAPAGADSWKIDGPGDNVVFLRPEPKG